MPKLKLVSSPKRKAKKPFGKRFAGGPKPPHREGYKITDDKFMTEPEVAKLLSILKTQKDASPRNVMLIHLALFSGARANEMLNVRKKDLLNNSRVHIFGLKGSNDRQVPIPSWLHRELLEAAEGLSQEDFLFDIKYGQLREIWCGLRPVKKKFHSLRHTFAIRLYKDVRDILVVQQALGHKNVLCSLVYLRFTQSEETMAKIVRSEDEQRYA